MTIKSFENLYLVCPLSLGDYFVCNALVRDFAELAHSVTMPVLPQFLATVGCLYQDCSNVRLVPYLGKEEEQNFIKTNNLSVVNFRTIFENSEIWFNGDTAPATVPVYWDRQLYEHFDMPFSRRYRDFRLPTNIHGAQELYNRLNPQQEPFVLWHRRGSNSPGGVEIDLASWRPSAGLDPNLKIIEVDLGHTPNLLDYVLLIERASEIHVIPSSMHCLVDSISTKISAILFYHDIRKNTLMQPNCRWNQWRWNVVKYPHKV